MTFHSRDILKLKSFGRENSAKSCANVSSYITKRYARRTDFVQLFQSKNKQKPLFLTAKQPYF